MLKCIELFSGIGGFRLGFSKHKIKVVMANDYDKYANNIYKIHWQDGSLIEKNVKELKTFPRAEVLVGGFPCPAFSIAGVSVRNYLNRDHGFEGEQGELFFEILRVAKQVRPEIIILENVKNILYYGKGEVFQLIKAYLEEAGYYVQAKLYNAAGYVPQKRQRVFIVCFRSEKNFENFEFPEEKANFLPVSNILEESVDTKYTLSDKLWNYLQNYTAKQKARGLGFSYNLVDKTKPTATLSARYHKDGKEILIPQKGKNPRKLTPLECERLMGFPDNWTQTGFDGKQISDTRRYMMLGNALVPHIVDDIMAEIFKIL